MSEKRLVLSAEELASDVALVHSDVYQSGDGWYWVVEHPASGWSASGRATSMREAYEAIDQAVEKSSGEKIETEMRLIRPQRDMP